MMLDALLAMMVYTLVTCAFYLLGAALLHQHGEVPEGYAMVETLSLLFTTTFGPWAKALFLGGAFAALYSTLFTATAGWSRVYSDALHQLGWWKMDSPEVERKAIQILSWFFPISWCLLFYFVKLPVWMILIGGVATTILLLLVVYGALSFRYRNTPQLLQPTRRYDVWLWASALAVIAFSILGLVQSLRS